MPNKSEYSKLLLDPNWQKKRLEIMQRDNFKCCLCGDDKTTLNVHHIKYGYNTNPWNYPNDNFITLCQDCHQLKHDLENWECNNDIVFDKLSIFKRKSEDSSYKYFILNNDGYGIYMAVYKEQKLVTVTEFTQTTILCMVEFLNKFINPFL